MGEVMDDSFDVQEARRHLREREKLEKEKREKDRKELLERVITHLQSLFSDMDVEVYLVGSITRPYRFTKQSDIDIVVKNFSGDLFALWAKIEEKVERSVEVILYEKCHFKQHVESEGLKVI